jgi:hypothetical protein
MINRSACLLAPRLGVAVEAPNVVRRRCCPALAIFLFIGSIGHLGVAAAQTSPPPVRPPTTQPAPSKAPGAVPDLPRVMHFCAANCFTLTWQNGLYVATANPPFAPGNSSTWIVERFTSESVILRRTDRNRAGAVTFGGVYSGQISNDGNRLINGTLNGRPDSFKLVWGTALNSIPGSNAERDRSRGPAHLEIAPRSATGGPAIATQPPPISPGFLRNVPNIMHFCAANCFTLTWENGLFIGTANPPLDPGAASKWTVESFTNDSVILHRTDTNRTGAVVFGGTFKGRISQDGNSLVNGTFNGQPGDFKLVWGSALGSLPGSNAERDSLLSPAEALARGKQAARLRNDSEALRYFLIAAQKGNAAAQNDVAFAYEHGVGVAANPGEALAWFQKSAAQGSTWGLDNVVRFYRDGVAGPKDPSEAGRLQAKLNEARAAHTKFCGARTTLRGMQSAEEQVVNDPNGRILQGLAILMGVDANPGRPRILKADAADQRQQFGGFELDMALDSGGFVCRALFLRTNASIKALDDADNGAQITAVVGQELLNKYPGFQEWFNVGPDPSGQYVVTVLSSSLQLQKTYAAPVPGSPAIK